MDVKVGDHVRLADREGSVVLTGLIAIITEDHFHVCKSEDVLEVITPNAGDRP
jgi:hypothetical protein